MRQRMRTRGVCIDMADSRVDEIEGQIDLTTEDEETQSTLDQGSRSGAGAVGSARWSRHSERSKAASQAVDLAQGGGPYHRFGDDCGPG